MSSQVLQPSFVQMKPCGTCLRNGVRYSERLRGSTHKIQVASPVSSSSSIKTKPLCHYAMRLMQVDHGMSHVPPILGGHFDESNRAELTCGLVQANLRCIHGTPGLYEMQNCSEASKSAEGSKSPESFWASAAAGTESSVSAVST